MYDLFKMTLYIDCPSEFTIHRLNYAVILLWGVSRTYIYLVFGTVLVCCFPLLIYMLCAEYSRVRQERRQREELIPKIFSLEYSEVREFAFSVQEVEMPPGEIAECSICLGHFND
jgi:hypothetical protein